MSNKFYWRGDDRHSRWNLDVTNGSDDHMGNYYLFRYVVWHEILGKDEAADLVSEFGILDANISETGMIYHNDDTAHQLLLLLCS
jgi:hypothetical protein